MSGQLCGGKASVGSVTDKGRELANQHRAEIEAKVGGKFDVFEPVQQTTQVVAGTNYFLKIRTGDNQYVHARVWHKLDDTSELNEVEGGKLESDAL